ncbi:hypothetical protein FQN54_005662 [Arachnomyces sp. PD_36]|nr:hypothetical protein FQN54_005662 [Arachnomyces sp. PD_36]
MANNAHQPMQSPGLPAAPRGILDLPSELFDGILGHVERKDLLTLKKVCPRLKNEVQSLVMRKPGVMYPRYSNQQIVKLGTNLNSTFECARCSKILSTDNPGTEAKPIEPQTFRYPWQSRFEGPYCAATKNLSIAVAVEQSKVPNAKSATATVLRRIGSPRRGIRFSVGVAGWGPNIEGSGGARAMVPERNGRPKYGEAPMGQVWKRKKEVEQYVIDSIRVCG